MLATGATSGEDLNIILILLELPIWRWYLEIKQLTNNSLIITVLTAMEVSLSNTEVLYIFYIYI